MIRFTQGNLLQAPAEALVNTVNEVGVMGKGIALMFKEAFPSNTSAYERAVAAGEVRVGRMFVTENRSLVGPKWIINFPTKKHWRHPSKFEWIREGLKDLAVVIQKHHIKSVAVPPLGCGNGGLDWAVVKPAIQAALADLADVDVLVYEPTGAYQNVQKRTGLEALTPARALVAELVRRYSVLGLDCTILEVQKLAWFLDRAIAELGLPDPLKLQFKPDRYGPYADRLRHLLDALDGSYLHSEKRLSDAGPFDLIWFEDAKRQAVTEYLNSDAGARYAAALEEASKVIDGFESPLGMELLATVDWLMKNGVKAEVNAMKAALARWPGGAAAAERKLQLFDDRLLGFAVGRLTGTL